MFLATEKVWHFWIAVPLAASAILLVLTIIGLYVAKVSRSRYPSSHS
ncbi:MAG: hypothetical protein KDB26_16025 [Microthrixaceae bacterium]|nr:hypothetical protein [Microthrixaceae bacterium]